MQNLEKLVEAAEKELERRAKLLEEVTKVANVYHRMYLGQEIDWDALGLSEVKEFAKGTDSLKWPEQEFPIDARHKYKGGGCDGGCCGC